MVVKLKCYCQNPRNHYDSVSKLSITIIPSLPGKNVPYQKLNTPLVELTRLYVFFKNQLLLKIGLY